MVTSSQQIIRKIKKVKTTKESFANVTTLKLVFITDIRIPITDNVTNNFQAIIL